MKNPFRAIRYHSLAVDRARSPPSSMFRLGPRTGKSWASATSAGASTASSFIPNPSARTGESKSWPFLNPRPRPSLIRAAAIRKASAGQDLEMGRGRNVDGNRLPGNATPAQIAGLLTALAGKGESVSRSADSPAPCAGKPRPSGNQAAPVIDTCGTGGDGSGTFNISTCAALSPPGRDRGQARKPLHHLPVRVGRPCRPWASISPPRPRSWKKPFAKSDWPFSSRPSSMPR